MSYYVKSLIEKQYEDAFDGVENFVVVETKGMDGVSNNTLRGELLKKGVRLAVVKNSLMRRTMTSLGMPEAADLFKSGPSTIAYGGDSIVDVAKEMVSWAKKIDLVKLKGAYVEGTSVDGEGVKTLSKMPTRAELQGQIVTIAMTPGAKVAGALLGPGGAIAGCLKTLIEKMEEGGE